MLQTLENDISRVIVDSFGAQLQSIELKKHGTQFLWQGDPGYWSDRSPLLFPVVGRLSGAVLRIDGTDYDVPKHGFARRSEFELVSRTDDTLVYRISDTPETLAVYPYKFTLDVEYSLKGNSLSIGFKVANDSDRRMYFSIGAHPGFNCPIESDEKFEDYYLEFEQAETTDRWVIEGGLLSRCEKNYLDRQNVLDLNYHVFKDDALVFKRLLSQSVSLCSKVSDRKVTVSFPGFKHLGIWTKQGAPYVCIEPWFGYDDVKGFSGDISEKEGIESIDSGEVFNSCYSITCK